MKKITIGYLATLGVLISTNEDAKLEVQRIDDPTDFALGNDLWFIPPLLSDDGKAKDIVKNIDEIMLNDSSITQGMRETILDDLDVILNGTNRLFRTVKVKVSLDVDTRQSVQDTLAGIKRGIFRGLDSEPTSIAAPIATGTSTACGILKKHCTVL